MQNIYLGKYIATKGPLVFRTNLKSLPQKLPLKRVPNLIESKYGIKYSPKCYQQLWRNHLSLVKTNSHI